MASIRAFARPVPGPLCHARQSAHSQLRSSLKGRVLVPALYGVPGARKRHGVVVAELPVVAQVGAFWENVKSSITQLVSAASGGQQTDADAEVTEQGLLGSNPQYNSSTFLQAREYTGAPLEEETMYEEEELPASPVTPGTFLREVDYVHPMVDIDPVSVRRATRNRRKLATVEVSTSSTLISKLPPQLQPYASNPWAMGGAIFFILFALFSLLKPKKQRPNLDTDVSSSGTISGTKPTISNVVPPKDLEKRSTVRAVAKPQTVKKPVGFANQVPGKGKVMQANLSPKAEKTAAVKIEAKGTPQKEHWSRSISQKQEVPIPKAVVQLPAAGAPETQKKHWAKAFYEEQEEGGVTPRNEKGGYTFMPQKPAENGKSLAPSFTSVDARGETGAKTFTPSAEGSKVGTSEVKLLEEKPKTTAKPAPLKPHEANPKSQTFKPTNGKPKAPASVSKPAEKGFSWGGLFGDKKEVPKPETVGVLGSIKLSHPDDKAAPVNQSLAEGPVIEQAPGLPEKPKPKQKTPTLKEVAPSISVPIAKVGEEVATPQVQVESSGAFAKMWTSLITKKPKERKTSEVKSPFEHRNKDEALDSPVLSSPSDLKSPFESGKPKKGAESAKNQSPPADVTSGLSKTTLKKAEEKKVEKQAKDADALERVRAQLESQIQEADGSNTNTEELRKASQGQTPVAVWEQSGAIASVREEAAASELKEELQHLATQTGAALEAQEAYDARKGLKQALRDVVPVVAVGAGTAAAFAGGVDGYLETVGFAALTSFLAYDLLWSGPREKLLSEIKSIRSSKQLWKFLKDREIINDEC